MLQRGTGESAIAIRGDQTLTGWFALPLYGWFGLTLTILSWIVSWAQIQPLATYTFFPLWLGYILLVDSIVLTRRGTSLMNEGMGSFIRLFVVSAFFWQGFEVLNRAVQNWHYLGTESFSRLGYIFFSGLAFSTVIPAVLETASLIGSFFSPDNFLTTVRQPAPPRMILVVVIGIATFLAPFVWPRQAYGFLWGSGLLIVEPINWYLGRPSVMRLLAAQHTSLILLLCSTGPVCGALWEMWNFYAYPKWYYVLPGISSPKFFEMPLPGMLGYPPFMLEVYAMYNLFLPLFGRFSAFERVLQGPAKHDQVYNRFSQV